MDINQMDTGEMICKIYAEYDNDKDIFCMSVIPFVSPIYEKVRNEKIGEYKYNDIETSYASEDFEEENIIVQAIEEKFKDAQLKVTKNEAQILEYTFPVELTGDTIDESETISMTELEKELTNILKNYWFVKTKTSCYVYDDGSASIEITAEYHYRYVTVSLKFVKQ